MYDSCSLHHVDQVKLTVRSCSRYRASTIFKTRAGRGGVLRQCHLRKVSKPAVPLPKKSMLTSTHQPGSKPSSPMCHQRRSWRLHRLHHCEQSLRFWHQSHRSRRPNHHDRQCLVHRRRRYRIHVQRTPLPAHPPQRLKIRQ